VTVRPVYTAAGSHARIVALLAAHNELTYAQLVRRYQTRAVRSSSPWPFAAESSLRTRCDELAAWGEVVEVSRDGRSPSDRPMRVWGLNPVPRLFADFDGRPVAPSAGLEVVVLGLVDEFQDLVVTEALRGFAHRVGLDAAALA
jgi:hypothetical protein